MQDIETARPFVPGHDIPHGVIAHMAHVDASGRIRKHFQHIIFRPRIVIARGKNVLLVPNPLPVGFAARALYRSMVILVPVAEASPN